jgi:hypothetical protein
MWPISGLSPFVRSPKDLPMRRFAFLSLIPLVLPGCGGGVDQFQTAKATGKVLCDGKPVGFVRVYFAPVGTNGGQLTVGKQGQGNANEDGIFTVSTYGQDDGAVVGKHNVMVSTPHPEDLPEFFCDCETNGNKTVQEVEVTAGGENNFTINLPPKKDKSKPNFKAEDVEEARQAAQDQAERLKGSYPEGEGLPR